MKFKFFTIITLLLSFGKIEAKQPFKWVFRDSQTIIRVDKNQPLEIEVWRNESKLDENKLSKIAKSRKTSGIWLEYASEVIGTEYMLRMNLYFVCDDKFVYITSDDNIQEKYKVPIDIFKLYFEEKLEIIWSQWKIGEK